MSKKMLIDASHEEETRVVIVDGTRVEDLDFESAAKRQLRGNVYLARVTRVEPSLQAAFIEYGGNRHGFLAFPEIHPDYYQIPYEDRLALQEEEEAIAAEAADEDSDDEVEEDENLDPDADDASDEDDAEVADEQVKVASTRRKRINRRKYKIQEVIKRGQILLVQAVKEERGNKGAALTTYLSLAGRYCVLMPNTPRGGGISRKIASQTDRKRLKSIMNNLDVPQGMGVIVRTAGAKKTKAEIKRDYDYLTALWDDIRETTMKSTAPALIHEEGNLVKRSLRDLYNKDIGEVLIQGEEAYETASAFIKMLMPSHADNVKQYTGDLPLFLEYGAEKQLEASLDATVQLKSGGYLVIHPTEALVSIDVNSGRSTKERNVERTALKTNLEAADEVARQMRMRDLAGLIVIDFIDMDENKNNRAVEKRMKEALARDRARVQYGRISQFGLMEISRQRRRRSLLEGSTAVCRHCGGVGRKRTVESSALKAIRALEELAARGKAARVKLTVAGDVADYINNEKRELLVDIEKEFGTFTEVVGSETIIRPSFELEVTKKGRRRDRIAEAEKQRKKEAEEARKEAAKSKAKAKEEPEEDHEDEDDSAEAKGSERTSDDGEDKPKRRRRGRRGGRGRRRSSSSESSDDKSDTEDGSDDTDTVTDMETDEADSKPKRRRRRAPSKSSDDAAATEAVDAAEDEESKPARKSGSTGRRRAPSKGKSSESKAEVEADTADDASHESSKSSRRRRAPAKSRAKAAAAEGTPVEMAPDQVSVAKDAEAEDAPKRRRRAPSKAKAAEAEDAKAEEAPKRKRRAPAKVKADADEPSEDAKPKRPRRAPSKAKSEEGSTEEAKPKRTRRAPSKAKADDAAVEDAPASTSRRKAPAKTASADAEAKPAARKRAPAKAKADKVETATDRKPASRRKAPAKAASSDDAPAAEPAAKAKTAPARKPASKLAAKAAETTDTPKKRGWWNRLKG